MDTNSFTCILHTHTHSSFYRPAVVLLWVGRMLVIPNLGRGYLSLTSWIRIYIFIRPPSSTLTKKKCNANQVYLKPSEVWGDGSVCNCAYSVNLWTCIQICGIHGKRQAWLATCLWNPSSRGWRQNLLIIQLRQKNTFLVLGETLPEVIRWEWRRRKTPGILLWPLHVCDGWVDIHKQTPRSMHPSTPIHLI